MLMEIGVRQVQSRVEGQNKCTLETSVIFHKHEACSVLLSLAGIQRATLGTPRSLPSPHGRFYFWVEASMSYHQVLLKHHSVQHCGLMSKKHGSNGTLGF